VDQGPFHTDEDAGVFYHLCDDRGILPSFGEGYEQFHFSHLPPKSFPRFIAVSIPITWRSWSRTGSALMLFCSSFRTAISTASSVVVVTTFFFIISPTVLALPGFATAFETSKVVTIPTSLPSLPNTGRWLVSPLRSFCAAVRISSFSPTLTMCRSMMSITRGPFVLSCIGCTFFAASMGRVGSASCILPFSIQALSSPATWRALRKLERDEVRTTSPL